MAKPRIAPRAGGTVRTEGFSELARQLERMADAVVGETLEASVLESVEPIRADMARRAPRSDTPGGTRGSGHAADNIGKQVASGSKPRRAEINVGPGQDYWHLVFAEFGTRHHAAQPWGRPAVDAGRDRYIRALRKSVRDRLRKAAR